MKNPTYKLTQSVRTAVGAKRLITKLNKIISSTHSAAKSFDTISKSLTTAQRQLLIEDLQDRNTTLSQPGAQTIISDIKDSIKKLPVATVELAFQSSAKFTEEITDSINSMIKTPCITEVKYNPAIGGGIIIYFQGRHHDYSLNSKFDELSKI